MSAHCVPIFYIVTDGIKFEYTICANQNDSFENKYTDLSFQRNIKLSERQN